MKNSSGWFTRKRIGVVIQLAALAVAACFQPAEAKSTPKVNIPVAAELYAAEPKPLAPGDCAQCHVGQFGDLRSAGTKHRFACQQCHQSFHAYNPKKGNWDAIMPKCSTCHAEPHGKTITDCAPCHSNPHAPKKVAMDAPLVKMCTECHSGPAAQLAAAPSKHTKVQCQKCHSTHGYKPTCFQCHKPHHADQEIGTCLKCHPVHQPLKITYDESTPAKTCGSCHTKVFDKWQKTKSKHGKVNCATCHHSKHKLVPNCADCHGLPHKKEIHARFPKCLDCHVDVHDLPSRQ